MTRSWIPIAMATVMITGCAEAPNVAQSSIAPLAQPVLATTVGNYRMEKPIDVGRFPEQVRSYCAPDHG